MLVGLIARPDKTDSCPKHAERRALPRWVQYPLTLNRTLGWDETSARARRIRQKGDRHVYPASI